MLKCPKCDIPLCRREIGGVAVHSCPDCHGDLVEDLRLAGLERRADPAWTDEQKDQLCRQADESNDLRETRCPHCGRMMRKRLFRGYAHLQVDQCPSCRCYWLDAGELEKMQILFQDLQAEYTKDDPDREE